MTIRFHERFEIEVDDKEAKKRFLNRVHNLILGQFWTNEIQYKNKVNIVHEIAWELGLEYKSGTDIKPYIGADFYRCLQALEVIHKNISGDPQKNLETFITRALQDSEIDLSIRWENGKFIKSGAKLLDEKLVNDSLRWLIDEDYQTVFEPFSKGLDHFLHAEKKPELLADVITDMYESLEALAKTITNRTTKDLSANAELFIQRLNVTEAYKRILKDYIAYANEFRHGVEGGKSKLNPSKNEVESFIYLTGLFIRLAMAVS